VASANLLFHHLSHLTTSVLAMMVPAKLGMWLLPLAIGHYTNEIPKEVTSTASALQKAATLSLSVARAEEESTPVPTERTESASILCLLLVLLLVAFGEQVIHPLLSAIRNCLFTFRSLGEVNGLPPSQRFCQDEVQRSFSTWLDVIPQTSDPFIREIGSRQPLTFRELHAFAKDKEVWLSRFGIGLQDRVCTMFPNGPEAAVCFLVFPLRCVFAPLNPAFTVPEIEFEFQDLPCHTVVVMDGEDNTATLQVATEQKVQVLEMQLHSKTAGLFSLRLHQQSPVNLEQRISDVEQQSARNDIALVLHTSGTTKKPKIVPLTHENLTVGALCIASTLCRQKSDVCLNLMPLYHIHGLSVNVLASAISGSSVICTPGYKGPDKPSEWLSSGLASWYSAVPTMHQGIVEACLSSNEFSANGAGIGLIRNCSAALVPVLADKMEQLFQCVVMPTYAMSESMPIASNPLPPNLRVLRSVGQAAGPQMVLRHEENNSEPKQGEEAEICVKGACVTKGYEMRAHMDQDPNIEAFTTDGWLRTGDKGYIDENNYLCLSGRYKEIINRGGEKISPFEVENVCRQWPPVFDCIAFSCPHAQLGETVGLAAVLRDGEKMDSSRLDELRRFGSSKMSEKWLPQCILFMKDIPKGSTGKPARIGLAKRMKLETLDIHKSQVTSWDATSGLPVPIDASVPTKKTAVDSLGKVREVNETKIQEMALLETMYGFAIMFVTLVHVFLENYEKTYGSTGYTSPFRPEQDPWQFGYLLAMNVKPVTLFLVCYGYLESQHRAFLFGGFQREIVLSMLVLFQQLNQSMFIVALEMFTGCSAPGGGEGVQKSDVGESLYLTLKNFLGMTTENPWFIVFILFARIIMLLNHKLGIPAGFQAVVCLATAVLLPMPQLEKRLSLGAMSMEYIMMLIGAYWAPAIVRVFSAQWNGATLACRCFVRLLALAYMVVSVRPPLATGFSDAARTTCFDSSFGAALCVPFTAAQQALWVGAVAILFAPKVGMLERLGRYTLGAYLFNRVTFVFLRDYGVQLFGVTVFPSLISFAQIFTGKAGEMGLTLGYLCFLLVIMYVTNLFTGFVCHATAGGLARNAMLFVKKAQSPSFNKFSKA